MSKASDLARLITSGSTAIHGEAGVTSSGSTGKTTNLQQGLDKFWANVVADGTSVSDSFNQGSFTDSGTGIGVCNFTSNMGNINYVNKMGSTLLDYSAGNSVRLSQVTVQATGSCNIDSFYETTSSEVAYEDKPKLVAIAGDLA